jgi:hypothetical protein
MQKNMEELKLNQFIAITIIVSKKKLTCIYHSFLFFQNLQHVTTRAQLEQRTLQTGDHCLVFTAAQTEFSHPCASHAEKNPGIQFHCSHLSTFKFHFLKSIFTTGY